MGLPLVEEEADAAEGGVEAEGAAKLFELGVFAVLVVLKRLTVAGGVRAVSALEHGRLSVLSGVFGQHVVAKLVFALAGVSADLTHERFGLVP